MALVFSSKINAQENTQGFALNSYIPLTMQQNLQAVNDTFNTPINPSASFPAISGNLYKTKSGNLAKSMKQILSKIIFMKYSFITYFYIFFMVLVFSSKINAQENTQGSALNSYIPLTMQQNLQVVNDTFNTPINPSASFPAISGDLYKTKNEDGLLNKIYEQKKTEAISPYIVLPQPQIFTQFEKKLSPYEPKTPTPSRFFLTDLSMPDNFNTTNNLAKKTGSFYRAFGEIIFIQGSISDSFGVPISNAVVEIWQTNSAGKYHTLLEKNSEFIDKYFNMSGRAITDNLGNYHFISIMPGSNPGRAPHINFNVYHPRFGRLETEMYFINHPHNQTDYQYLAYSATEQDLITADVRTIDFINPDSIKLCTFDIVLKGVHQFKKF